ncbi:hypothetical protein DFJ58DRAFT_843347 [Suillus subalutaceus]|uniref:uncharacterized protein n=1 Tax=Suillus subalutaceus TaxID=48586 RepID=UPI001B873CD6|nr:uncharacterized protein DFJ58DRAFT_843347 [Suillus subalutaceus]KAG1847031.1 hypothetical protein DFJ58DRAFT_843347 [Suillus subalutaceus]
MSVLLAILLLGASSIGKTSRKSASVQAAVQPVAGPAKAWQPVTGAGEAEIARVTTATAGEQLLLSPCNDDVIGVDALGPVTPPGEELANEWRLSKGLFLNIPVGASDEILSRFGGDPRQEVEEDQGPLEMINRTLDNALGYGKTPEDLAKCMRRGLTEYVVNTDIQFYSISYLLQKQKLFWLFYLMGYMLANEKKMSKRWKNLHTIQRVRTEEHVCQSIEK